VVPVVCQDSPLLPVLCSRYSAKSSACLCYLTLPLPSHCPTSTPDACYMMSMVRLLHLAHLLPRLPLQDLLLPSSSMSAYPQMLEFDGVYFILLTFCPVSLWYRATLTITYAGLLAKVVKAWHLLLGCAHLLPSLPLQDSIQEPQRPQQHIVLQSVHGGHKCDILGDQKEGGAQQHIILQYIHPTSFINILGTTSLVRRE
jgi:hypothetical protein